MGFIHDPKISTGSIPIFNFIPSKATKPPAIAAIVTALTLLYIANYVSASSGGVMGGSFWEDSSSSSSDNSWSYSSSHDSGDDDSWSHSSRWSSRRSSPSYHDYEPEHSQDNSGFRFVAFVFGVGVVVVIVSYVRESHANKVSVIKVQIGLYGKLRPLQNDLNQIARSVNTSTRWGMRYILTGTLESLISHRKSYISAYSSSKTLWSIDKGKKFFDQLSRSEQGKFDEETLVNVNSVKRERTEMMIRTNASKMYLVITILVAARGGLELSSINTPEELLKALRKLLFISESETMAVRTLWTPQQNLDTLSYEQLLEDYPLLRPLDEDVLDHL